MIEDDDDARLVAFIDGELNAGERLALESRLKGDAELRERLERLREGDRPFAAAFEGLLDKAPVERLRASLDAHVERRERRAAPRISRVASLAAAGIVIFCAGLAVGRFGPGWFAGMPEISERAADDRENWRQAVAEYMELYTPDTFASQPAGRDSALAAIGAKLGLPLTPERVALANLPFAGAQILAFHGEPLGELVYIDPATGPVLFCIIRDSEPDAATTAENLGEFASASWARSGRGYMLIGRLPAGRIAALADSLSRQF